MDRIQNILQASLLWRLVAVLSLWFSDQWANSRIIQRFLHPSSVGEAISKSSVFHRLFSHVLALLRRIYWGLHLDRLFSGSMFLAVFFWCGLASMMAPILPTMLALGLVLVAYASLALSFMQRKSRELVYAPYHKYLLLFAGVYLCATAMSVAPRDSLFPGLLTVAFILFPFVVEHTLETRQQLVVFTASLVLAGTFVSLLGIGQYFLGVTGASAWVDSEMFGWITTRVYSTLQNPNMLASYLVLIIPLGGAALLAAKGWGMRVFWLCCCGIMSLCLILTLSRGGWLGLLIAGGLFLLFLNPKLLLLIPVLLAAMAFLLPDTIIARFTSIGDLGDSSTSYRVSIWMGSIAMLRDYWLAGIGPGTEAFNMVYPAYSYNAANAQHAHNLFLQLVAEGGICALALFLVVVFVFARYLCSALNRNRNWETRVHLIAILAGGAGFLAQGMTDHSFYNYRVMLMFWVIVGLGGAWARYAGEEAREP